MSTSPHDRVAHAARSSAAIAFWVAALLFVAGVAALNGWLPEPLAATPPSVRPDEAPTDSSPAPVGITLDGGGSVTFPVPVTRSEERIDLAGTEVTVVRYSGTDAEESPFNIGVVEYPPHIDLSDPVVNLLASVSGAAGGARGRVVSQEVTRYADAPAVVFEIDSGAVRLAARNVLAGRRLYSQSVAYRGAVRPNRSLAFFMSLDLPPR